MVTEDGIVVNWRTTHWKDENVLYLDLDGGYRGVVDTNNSVVKNDLCTLHKS